MRLSLRKKLIISFSLAFCILIAGFGSVILQTNGARYRDQGYAYCRRIVEVNITLIDNYFSQLKSMMQVVGTDQDVLSAVSYRIHNQQIDYSIELYNQRRVASKMQQFEVLENVTNVIIVGPQGEYFYYYGPSPIRKFDFSQQPWFSNNIAQGKLSFLNYHPTDYLLNPTTSRTVSLMEPIFNSRAYYFDEPAYLLCDFELEPLLTRGGRDDETQIAIFSGTEPVYMPPQLELTAQQQQQLEENLASGQTSFMLVASGKSKTQYLVQAEASEISGWLILGIMPLSSIQSLQETNRVFVLSMIALAFVIIFGISNVLARSMLVPMNTLIEKFNAIGRGEKNVRFEKTASIEVDRIAQTAAKMLQKNNELTEKLLEEGKERANAQMRALQHQINPHFLNNVLQSMKALAVCGDTEAISKMTTLLGKLLTYSVYAPYEMVPLEDEFDYTETYIALQNVRFQQKIHCCVILPEEARNFPVPKLIIQPLAENAIEHGFALSEGGKITLTADLDEEALYIAVTNSGRTIDARQVEELNQMLRRENADTRRSSIGLLNLQARLKGCFGSGAQLQVLSRDGMNTSIVLTLPRQKEE